MLTIADSLSVLTISADPWKSLAEVLGVPALVLGVIYTCVQIRKAWLDSQKTMLEIERIQTERQASGTAAPAPEQETPTGTVNRSSPALTRLEGGVFISAFAFYYILFYWSARNADIVVAIRGMLVNAVCIIALIATVLFLAGLRRFSRLLLDQLTTIGEMLVTRQIQQLNTIGEMLVAMHKSQCGLSLERGNVRVSPGNAVASPQIDDTIGEEAHD